jgi:hypothetical protein
LAPRVGIEPSTCGLTGPTRLAPRFVPTVRLSGAVQLAFRFLLARNGTTYRQRSSDLQYDVSFGAPVLSRGISAPTSRSHHPHGNTTTRRWRSHQRWHPSVSAFRCGSPGSAVPPHNLVRRTQANCESRRPRHAGFLRPSVLLTDCGQRTGPIEIMPVHSRSYRFRNKTCLWIDRFTPVGRSQIGATDRGER